MRRLKTKYRHVYYDCVENGNELIKKGCSQRHDSREVFKIFAIERFIEDKKEIEINRRKKDRCHMFSWC